MSKKKSQTSDEPEFSEIKRYQVNVNFQYPFEEVTSKADTKYYRATVRIVSENPKLKRVMAYLCTKEEWKMNIGTEEVRKYDVVLIETGVDILKHEPEQGWLQLERNDGKGFSPFLWNWKLVKLVDRPTVQTTVY